MPAPFIVVNTYAIQEGRLEDFRQFLLELFTVLEATEPRLRAVNAYGSRTAPRQRSSRSTRTRPPGSITGRCSTSTPGGHSGSSSTPPRASRSTAPQAT